MSLFGSIFFFFSKEWNVLVVLRPIIFWFWLNFIDLLLFFSYVDSFKNRSTRLQGLKFNNIKNILFRGTANILELFISQNYFKWYNISEIFVYVYIYIHTKLYILMNAYGVELYIFNRTTIYWMPLLLIFFWVFKELWSTNLRS